MFWQLLLAVLVVGATYFVRKLYFSRFEQHAKLPQHPASLALGHLDTIDKYTRKLPPKANADMVFAAMHEDLGRPPIMYVDLRPISPPMVVVASHQVAEQIVKASDRWPYSVPKVTEVWQHYEHITGPSSIISTSGEHWKALRKRFNPGFAPQNLVKLLPRVLEKALLLVDHLDHFASNGQEFSLQDYATDLTFDIIGLVAMDVDMKAQTQHPSELMQVFRSLIATYADEQFFLPWWCTPFTEWKRYNLSQWVRKNLSAVIRDRYAEDRGQGSFSILSMSLRDLDALTPDIVDETCDQLTSFLFAGHDTTSTLMSWVIYELSRTPHALRAVRAELDELFGPDPSPSAVCAALLAPGGKELLYRMSYTSIVIKETLRLWGPGATSRMTKPGDGFTINTPDGELCLDGLMMYHVHPIIQRDPSVFGDNADIFVPERWLEDTDKFPAGAWRAFERGPRVCIGQELATIEARVLIALIARRFDFSKVGTGATLLSTAGVPEMDNHGQYKVASEMYTTRQVTSKPVDSMMMRVNHIAEKV